MLDIKILKRSELATLPTKSYDAAGWDLYYCSSNKETIYIHPGESVILDTGLSFYLPDGYCAWIENRSGIASKKNLLKGAAIIDCDYSGNVFVNLHNAGKSSRTIEHGDKIAQFLLVPVPRSQILEVDETEFIELHHKSHRGDAGFGSTDKQL